MGKIMILIVGIYAVRYITKQKQGDKVSFLGLLKFIEKEQENK